MSASSERSVPQRVTAATTVDAVFAQIAANAAEHDRHASFAHEAFELLHAHGLLGLTVPADRGGGGLGAVASCSLVESLGVADPAVGLVVSQHLMMHAHLAREDNVWPSRLRELVQQTSVDEGALINIVRVEPDLGTPSRGGLPSTVARRLPDGRGWSITGRKTYATGIPRLRWMAVWARTDDPEPLVGTFLVDTRTPGYEVVETWDHLGMRATRSDDVVFDELEVPLDHAVDIRTPAQFASVQDPMLAAWNNLVISALYHGVAVSARDWWVEYLRQRTPTNLGRPLSTLPRFQAIAGEIEVLLHTSDRLVHDLATRVDASPDNPGLAAEAALVKTTATNNAIRAVELAIASIGNPGLSRRHPLERHYRDVLCSRIHTPQDDTIVANAGRGVLIVDEGGPVDQ